MSTSSTSNHPHRTSDDVFASFFGAPPPPKDPDQIYAEFFGPPNGAGAAAARTSESRSRKAPDVETLLSCSLEDLYNGGNKKVRISRKVIDSSGKLQNVKEIVTIEIKPGWEKGTKITFVEKGNQKPGFIPADLIFVIDEKPHEVFTRDGNDLIINRKIPLLEALTEPTIEQTTLDGRNLTIPVTEIIKPGYDYTIFDEGMPISKEPTKKGNLVFKFDIEYPTTTLTINQKYHLKKALAGNP